MTSTTDFLRLFFSDNEQICFRAIPPRGVEGPVLLERGSIHELENGSGVRQRLARLNRDRGLYFVVNSGGDTDSVIDRYNACFAEDDHRSIAEQHRKLDAAPLPTSARVQTKRSVHAYWGLRREVSLDAWNEVQQRLIAF